MVISHVSDLFQGTELPNIRRDIFVDPSMDLSKYTSDSEKKKISLKDTQLGNGEKRTFSNE